ncbi:TPA: WXG100 family type VII secretion target [Streptococcus agalactiae]|nr:WXG100 family type VII secretion target [Streptococcus agalactiae]
MSQIKLTPEVLRASAQKYTIGSQSITDVLTALTQVQAVIDENWGGTAFDSFEAQFNELSPKITQFAQLLEDINQQLLKVADVVEQTDSDIASQINQ